MVELANGEGKATGPDPQGIRPHSADASLRSRIEAFPGIARGRYRRLPLRERFDRLRSAALYASAEERRHGHVFLFVPVCLGLGAVLWFQASPSPPVMAIFASIAFCFGCAIAMRASDMQRAFFWSLALVGAGMLLADWETRRAATTILDQPVVTIASGIVERREAGSGAEWRYVVRLTGTADPTIRRPPERVSLLARSRHSPIAIGEGISGRVRLSPPSGPALPGMNDFAFQSYYAGIGAVGFFLGPPAPMDVVSPSATADGLLLWFDKTLFSWRDRISSRIRTVLPGDTGAFAASIITGERRSMSPEATEALRLSGLAHITAISGLNMALAAGIFFVGLRAMLSLLPVLAQRFPIKKIAAAGALIATTGYVLISGYQVSALRAYLMTAIMLTAVLLDRPAISLRNLALAAIGMIIIQPSAVMGPSFQMSFAATAALIAGYAGWTAKPPELLPRARALPARFAVGVGKFALGTLLTSLIGGMSTAIFSIEHFHRLSTHGLEANLAAMPLISVVVMPAGFIAMLLMPFGLDAPFLWAMGEGLDLVLVVAHTVASWGEGYAFPRQPMWFMAGTVSGLLLFTLLRTRLRLIGAVVFAATVVAAWWLPQPSAADLYVSEDARLVAFWSGLDDGQLATNRKRPPAFLFDQWRPVLDVSRTVPPVAADLPPLPESASDRRRAERLAQERRAGAPRSAEKDAELRQQALARDLDASAGGAGGEEPESGENRPRWESLSDADREQAAKTLHALLAAARPDSFTCVKGACAAIVRGYRVLVLERPDLVGPACDAADIAILAARSRVTQCRFGAILFTESGLRKSGSLELTLGDKEIEKSKDDDAWKARIGVTSAFEGLPHPWTAHRLYDWRSGTTAESHDMPRGHDAK